MPGNFRVFPILLAGILLSTAACGGGGGGGGGTQPPPPQPDFTIAVSSTTIDLSQGTTSSPVNLTVDPTNDFSSTVSVSFSGLPDGITTSPTTPFPVAPGSSVSILFGATSDASAGQFAVTAKGSSGSLSHSSAFTLDIHQSVPVNLPRTSFAPNDSVASADDPAGEPRQRHIVYDAASQRLYAANRAMNRAEVWNSANRSLIAAIDVPGASSVDLSPDSKTLWVGTATELILAIDTTALQVKAHYPVPGLSPIPGAVFNRPTEVLSLSSGKLAVRLRQSAASQSLLAIWEPSSNAFTNLTSLAPAVFQNGAGVLVRSADRSRILAAANDSTGELALFDALGNLLAGPQAPVSGAIPLAAAAGDGAHYAVVSVSGSACQLLLLDSRLNILASYPTKSPAGVLFSQDSQTIYVDESFGDSYVVTALSASDLQPLGQVPDIPIHGMPTQIRENCGTLLLCGLANRGISFLDASQPIALPQAAPAFGSVPAAQPSEGPSTGGTSVTLTGTNFSANAQIRFGNASPGAATLVSNSQLQASAPPNTSTGPTNLFAYFSTVGWQLPPTPLVTVPRFFASFPTPVPPPAATRSPSSATALAAIPAIFPSLSVASPLPSSVPTSSPLSDPPSDWTPPSPFPSNG